MIPPTISDDIKSPAERAIFSWLENLNWEDSIVLHSLGISNHISKVFGEIDFVIIADEGILCVEVKGGTVGRKDGKWFFKNRHGHIDMKNEGPFEQAQGNMNSLRSYLRERLQKNDPIVRCQFACCVMTPDCQMNINGIDIIPEITFNSSMAVSDLPSFFSKSFKYWKNKMIEKHGFCGGKLINSDKERLIDILRGDFQFVPNMSLTLKNTDESLMSLTDEQYDILENSEINDRLLISGPAGTGKTMLAIEQCRRLYAEGKKVLYLCYNSLIAEYVRQLFIKEKRAIDVYTLYGILMEKCKLTQIDKEDKHFFDETLPDLFLEKTKNGEISAQDCYQVIIVDEGQDLANTIAYICLDKLIDNGIEKGKWTVYYDLNQNIYNSTDDKAEIWKELKNTAFSARLTRNCRNTVQIANANWLMTNITQAKRVSVNGENVVYSSYETLLDERKQVIKAIRYLRAQGIGKNEIVLLSQYRIDNSKCCLYNYDVPDDIGEIRFNEHLHLTMNDFIRFYTIKSFKGLEAKVVLLLDVTSFSDMNGRLQNYVAISRARTYLNVFYEKNAEQDRQKMLINGSMVAIGHESEHTFGK